ncbi:MAG: BMP family ABC transporter substrate-binding protein [Lachnospiraceae bacterium]
MSEQYYKEALRAGQREKRRCIAHGEDPNLKVLDQMIPQELLLSGNNIGIVQVPAEFIVGTKTEGRTGAFARNFMPLFPEQTEFSEKWKRLCDAHLEEGIRDPVKLYEYMNRFYVEEGNKRVSVLKFFEAVTIPAEVIRILPPKDDTSKEVKVYYEFIDFYRYSKINYLEFSDTGKYAMLQKLLGKAPNELWTEEERNRFQSAHYYFKRAYESLGGDRLKSTVGDAMLVYIRVYGYQKLCSQNQAEIKLNMLRAWEEITLLQEEQSIDLKVDPEEEKKMTFLHRMLGNEAVDAQKVAFIYDKNPVTSGWVYGHELGRLHVQKVFDGKIVTSSYDDAMERGAEEVIEKAIADGNKVIFTTTAKLLEASLKAAIAHPEVRILNCSLNKPHRYIRTYYARMYEVKFIIGAIAGAMADNDKIGYICDYPIVGQIAGINAFALGVQMVNPRAKIYLEWSSVSGLEPAMLKLREREISIISSQDLAKLKGMERTGFGLFKCDETGQTNLAMPIWHWGVYYETLLRSMMEHTFQWEYETSNRALNYYWGMSAGVVELICSNHLPKSVCKLTELLKDAICNGLYSPFHGPIYAQDGRKIEGTDQVLSLKEIINMDWLAENIEGSIPVYEELNEEGKATVESAGAPVGETGGNE